MRVTEKYRFTIKNGVKTEHHTTRAGAGKVIFELKLEGRTVQMDRRATKAFKKTLEAEKWGLGSGEERRHNLIAACDHALKEAKA